MTRIASATSNSVIVKPDVALAGGTRPEVRRLARVATRRPLGPTGARSRGGASAVGVDARRVLGESGGAVTDSPNAPELAAPFRPYPSGAHRPREPANSRSP